ncbi:hypothetical protein, partial [Aetokthonos hydrillicola]
MTHTKKLVKSSVLILGTVFASFFLKQTLPVHAVSVSRSSINKSTTDTRIINLAQSQNISSFQTNGNARDIEKALVNTVWVGKYRVYSVVHTTQLIIKSVATGYIGGEMVHKEISPGNEGLLRVKVAGDIITQYLVDLKGDGSFQWVDQDWTTPEQLAKISIKETRQLIRLKRFRGMEYKTASNGAPWSSNREYRLLLQGNQLTGTVAVPAPSYGSSENRSDCDF